MIENQKEDFFPKLDADDVENGPTEVESLCMSCGKNGTTKLLLTSIPFYRSVILSSFVCPHCGAANNSIQPAGEILAQGVTYKLSINCLKDLNRQLVKSDHAGVTIPELELEIPPLSQKGEVTTVEGILQRVADGLGQGQEQRKKENPEDFKNIQDYIGKIQTCLKGEKKFTLILRDISGHSFVSPSEGDVHGDEGLTMTKFTRTKDEDHAVGYFPDAPPSSGDVIEEEEDDLESAIHQFSTPCGSCGKEASTKMKLTKIPHFKEVVIMSSDCDACGWRSNEVKSGGGMEPKGRKISLKVTEVEDLSRDILKSETCSLSIPDLDFQVGGGTVGGKFTTVEGLLSNVKDQLQSDTEMYLCGDSTTPTIRSKMEEFCKKLSDLMEGKKFPFTLVLDDPAGNSYLQNTYAPDDDPNLEILDYERTFDQNESLGINDMDTGDDHAQS